MVITADGRQAKAELAATGESVLGLDANVKKAGESIQGVGTKMLLVGGALDIGIAAAATMAGKFQEDTVALVHGAGESKDSLAMVTQGLLDMAGAVGETPDKLAQGMYLVESAGYHGAAGLQVMEAAAKGARIGMADQATVADAVTSALNAYHLTAADATGVTGQLIQTVATGKMHMQDLAGALGTVLPAASLAHVSLQEVGAALATMTMQGTPAADAATYLRQTLLQLQNPSGKAKKVLEELGFVTTHLEQVTVKHGKTTQKVWKEVQTASTEVADTLTSKGLYAALNLIQEHLNKKFPEGGAAATAALATLVGGTKSMQAALELTGKNLPVFAANIKNVGTEAQGVTKFEEDWALVSTTAAEKFDKLKGSLAAMAIEVGTALLPSLEQLMTTVTPIVKQIADFAKAHGDLVAKVLLGAAAFFTIGGIILTVAGTVAIFLAVLNPVTAIVLGIIAVIALLGLAWATNFGGIRDITAQAMGLAREAVEFAMNAIQSVIQTVLGAVAPFVQSELNQITNWWINNHVLIQQTVATILGVIQSIWQTFGGTITGLIGGYLQVWGLIFSVGMQFIGQVVSTVWNIIKIVIDTYIHDVLDIITIVMDIITGNWGDAWAKVQDLLSTTWNALGNIVKDGVNLIISFIDDLIGAWNQINFSIPGFSVTLPSVTIPGVGTVGGNQLAWGGVNIHPNPLPSIPLLDSGGVVSGPTLAMLAGNSRPEAIVPLDRANSLFDTDRLAERLAEEVAKRPTYQINANYAYQSERSLRDDVRMLQLLGAHV